MFDTTSPRMFVVTTIDGFSAVVDESEALSYSIERLSPQAANASEITAATAVVDKSSFFIELRNIHNLL